MSEPYFNIQNYVKNPIVPFTYIRKGKYVTVILMIRGDKLYVEIKPNEMMYYAELHRSEHDEFIHALTTADELFTYFETKFDILTQFKVYTKTFTIYGISQTLADDRQSTPYTLVYRWNAEEGLEKTPITEDDITAVITQIKAFRHPHIREIVVTMGDKSEGEFSVINTNSLFRSMEHGFAELEITPENSTVRFRNQTNAILYNYTIAR